jgi:PAS domain S-box-containing protein/putative nucleotidyltransferase with HDIG domain
VSERIDIRLDRMVREKARLQLIAHAVGRIGVASSLDETVSGLLLTIMDTFGGSETALYYEEGGGIVRTDVHGHRARGDVPDGLAGETFVTRQRTVREHGFEDTRMLTSEFSAAWDWALPLLVGSELVGVLELRDTHLAPQEIEAELGPLLDHAALVLKDRLLDHARTDRAARLAAIVESSDDAIIGKTLHGVVTSWNRSAEVMYGYSEAEMLGGSLDRLIPPGRDDELPRILERLAAGEHIHRFETVRRRKDGALIDISMSVSPIRDAAGRVIAASTVARDVTEAKAAEERIRRANRELHALSECNQVLVRANDEQSLVERVCRVVAEIAGYRMVWVGYVEAGESKWIRPVARGGRPDGYLDTASITWDDTPVGRGPAGTAVRERRTCHMDDLAAMPGDDAWRREALAQGYRSAIALPLLDDAGVPFGVLGVFSGEAGAFTPSEERMLAELAGDLAFGITALRTRAARDRSEDALRHTVSQLQALFEEVIQSIGRIVEVRDPYTAGHERRVAQLAAELAARLGWTTPEAEAVRFAGLLHDVGKIGVPSEILTKPAALTPMEFELIKSHPRITYELLKDIEFPWPIARIALQHHERLDGSGYPEGLSGEQIISPARLLAVADVVEAMASHRPYRPALGIEAALEEVESNSGVLYDPVVVDACLALFRDEGFVFAAAEM